MTLPATTITTAAATSALFLPLHRSHISRVGRMVIIKYDATDFEAVKESEKDRGDSWPVS